MDSLTSSLLIEGDREEAESSQRRQEDAIEQVLHHVGIALDGAEQTLTHLEDNADLLPSAILRKCQELADGIASLASRLEEHSPEEQRALAQACMEDFQSDLALQQPQHELTVNIDPASDSRLQRGESANKNDIGAPTEEEFMSAIQAASTLLRDVEAVFRELSESDAEDISDAALTLARLFLISFQNVHDSLAPEDFMISSEQQQNKGGVVIEQLEDETSSSYPAPQTKSHSNANKKRSKRIRVLWPRLGPQVAQVLDWGKEAASERPLLAAALGLTLWPAAIATSLVGGSLVLVDNAVQDIYQFFQDGPLVSSMEQGAAQLLQAGKLGLVLTSVMAKQTFRVVQRQVKRHGGIEHLLEEVKGAAVDRLVHPVETIGMAWDGISWGVISALETVQQIMEQRNEWLAAQDLQ